MMSNLFLAPAFIAMSFPLAAVAKLDSSSFLASAFKAPAVEVREKSLSGAEPGFLNPIDKLQLSAEADVGARRNNHAKFANGGDFNNSNGNREYGMKIAPRGFTEYRVERQLQAQLHTFESIALKREIGKALEERYLALIDHALAGAKASVRRDFLRLSEREIAVLAAANRASRTDARDLMKVRESHQEVKLESEQAAAEFAASAKRLKSLDPSLKDDQLVIGDLRSPVEAEKTMPKPDGIWTPKSPDVALVKQEAEMAKNESIYGMARATRWVDSIDLKIEQNADEDIYKVGVTFNVPGFASNDYGTREKARKAVLADIEAQEAVREHTSEFNAAKVAFDKAMSAYRSYVGSSADAAKAVNSRLKRIAQREDSSLVLLIQKTELNDRLKLMEASAEALRAYIEYLSIAGVLADNPKENYLARGSGEKSL